MIPSSCSAATSAIPAKQNERDPLCFDLEARAEPEMRFGADPGFESASEVAGAADFQAAGVFVDRALFDVGRDRGAVEGHEARVPGGDETAARHRGKVALFRERSLHPRTGNNRPRADILSLIFELLVILGL